MEAGDELTLEYDKEGEVTGGSVKELIDAGFDSIPVLDIDNVNIGPYIRNTLAQDKNMNRETALLDIYRVMRQVNLRRSKRHLLYLILFSLIVNVMICLLSVASK